MFNAQKLFHERLSYYIKEVSRYIKYIVNGHMAVAMIFLIVALAIYYQQWLEQLSDQFPATIVIALVFGFCAMYNPIQTLLKEPDLVFLIPAEQKMTPYFRQALIFSYIKSALPILFIIAAVSPLYFHAYPHRSGKYYLLTFMILLVFKGWNMMAQWWMFKIREKKIRGMDYLLRFVLSGFSFYFFLHDEMIYASVLTVLLIGLVLNGYSLAARQPGLAWEFLIEKDEQKMQSFYRMANLFTEVPAVKKRVKKRHWLVSFVDKFPFQQKHTYEYLYSITFIRSGDYLGLYLRLTIVGGLFILFIPNVYMKVAFALVFLYLTSFQLMVIYQHYRTNILLDLYPLAYELRGQAVTKALFQLTFLQVAIFGVILLFSKLYLFFIGFLVLGSLFNVVFTKIYMPKKWI